MCETHIEGQNAISGNFPSSSKHLEQVKIVLQCIFLMALQSASSIFHAPLKSLCRFQNKPPAKINQMTLILNKDWQWNQSVLLHLSTCELIIQWILSPTREQLTATTGAASSSRTSRTRVRMNLSFDLLIKHTSIAESNSVTVKTVDIEPLMPAVSSVLPSSCCFLFSSISTLCSNCFT